MADKGYSYARTRAVVGCCVGSRFRTPSPSDAINGSDGRFSWAPLTFDKTVYARRNVVERCINRLKQWRGLATRYEKRAVNYRAMVVIASIVIWLDS
ncbi:MAG TPA: transposase [Ktedonobacterales bacterium]